MVRPALTSLLEKGELRICGSPHPPPLKGPLDIEFTVACRKRVAMPGCLALELPMMVYEEYEERGDSGNTRWGC
jgi:hypothetical protein